MISLNTTFVRACPFVFEIDTIVKWISRKTQVSLGDFFIVRDVSLQLEQLVARQMNPKYGERSRPMQVVGWGMVIALGVLLFVPLFFFTDSLNSQIDNPPQSITLEIGIDSIPSIFVAKGTIYPVTAEEQRLLPSDADPIFLETSNTYLSRIVFPTFSFSNWEPEATAKEDLARILTGAPSFYRFTINFAYPAGQTESTTVVWQIAGDIMAPYYAEMLARYIIEKGAGIRPDDQAAPISLPLTLGLPVGEPVQEPALLRRAGKLRPSVTVPTLEWNLLLQDPPVRCPLWDVQYEYAFILWSQGLETGVSMSSAMGSAGGVVAIYVLVMFVIGLLLRMWVVSGVDKLWITEMQRPKKLYSMVVAIQAFRAAMDREKEAEIVQQFLNTLRSKEMCLKITASDSLEPPL
jgi:tetrahydromethanopterin S-methyltransferase subunit F